MPLTLMWFRSDLRVQDNRALAAAAARGPVVAVFLRSLPHWRRHGHGANPLDFRARGVAALGEALAGLNIPLLHRDIEDFAESPAALLAIARETGASALHFNHEYPLDEQRRDAAVLAAFRDAGLEAHGHHDSVAFAPGELLTGKGDYYGVFTPFAKSWHRQLTAESLALADTPAPQAETGIACDPLPALPELEDAPIDGRQWPAGEGPAADRLERFLRFRGRYYAKQRDFPAIRGTSELSPYLALGMISHRQCLQAVLAENDGSLAEGDAGLVAWVNELVWREFYRHVAVELAPYQFVDPGHQAGIALGEAAVVLGQHRLQALAVGDHAQRQVGGELAGAADRRKVALLRVVAATEAQEALQAVGGGAFAGGPLAAVDGRILELGQRGERVAGDAGLRLGGGGVGQRQALRRQLAMPALREGGEDAVVVALAGEQLPRGEGHAVVVAMGLEPGITEGGEHGGVAALLVQRVFVVEVQGAGAGLPGDGQQRRR